MNGLDELQKALDKMIEESEVKSRLLVLKEQFITGSDTSSDRWMEQAYRLALMDVKEKVSVFRQSQEATLRKLEKQAKTTRQRIAFCCENWNSALPCESVCDEPLVPLSLVKQVFGRATVSLPKEPVVRKGQPKNEEKK